LYWQRNHQTDEEIEKLLEENYTKNIEGNRNKKQDMVNFFAAMKDPSANPEQERKMNEVLYGGKGEMKRPRQALYGAEEGIEKKKLADEEGKKKAEKRKKKKKKKKKKDVDADSVGDETLKMKEVDQGLKGSGSAGFAMEKQSVAAVGAVGVLALAALLLGNKRS
jgi:hypothetical protein